MPLISPRIIQVSFTYTYEPVTAFAGNDMNVICDVTVTLAGSIDGTINKHTYEWVQLSGTPVVINDANTLTAWFVNPNTDDLSFRLYVDRNTPNETFDDVTVFRNPVSRATVGGNRNISISSFDSLSDMAVQSNLSVVASVVPRYYSDELVTEEEGAFANTTEYMIVWSIPSDIVDLGHIPYQNTPVQSYEFQGVYVQQYNGATWVTSAFIPKVREYYILPANDGTPYRVQSVWKLKQWKGAGGVGFEERVFIITPADSWGILRSLATSPAPLRAHGNSRGVMVMPASPVSAQFNFGLVINNPSRISYLAISDGVVGGSANITSQSFSDSSRRVQGKLFDIDDTTGVTGATNLVTISTALSITRVSGISIG